MVDNRYIDFLNKLINETKERKIDWKYLDSNKPLYEGMNWTTTSTNFILFVGEKEKVSPNFNTEDSFYANENGTNIVIYVLENQPASLFIVPGTYKKIVELAPEDYGEYITRLLNLVQSQFPSADAFIDDFLKDKKIATDDKSTGF